MTFNSGREPIVQEAKARARKDIPGTNSIIIEIHTNVYLTS